MRLRATLFLPVLAVSISTMPGCGLFQRSPQASHVEDEAPPQAAPAPTQPTLKPAPTIPPSSASSSTSDNATIPSDPGDPFAGTSPAPQHIEARAKSADPLDSSSKLEDAATLYQRAESEQNDGAFVKAASLWKEFLDRDPGLPGYERASYLYGFCLFSLGRPDEAAERLKALITSSADARLINDARILLAESLIQLQKPDEALATTFDVLPNRAGEEAAGLKRDSNALGSPSDTIRPNLVQKIRLYTIRGRIFASLGQDEHAHDSLERAKALLVSAKKNQISRKDMRFLSANYAWRQIEVQALACQHTVRVPERLSESEFLAYADAYYGCAGQARHLYCTVLAAGNEQVKAQALVTYQGLAMAPLELRDHLPPPAREIKKPEQRSYYESDMKALIEKTVAERTKEFRDLPACHAHDIF